MQEVTETVLRAVKHAGVRAILAEGGLCNSHIMPEAAEI